LNIEEIAARFKVHPGTIRHWIRRGLPVVSPGGRGIAFEIDPDQAVEWHRKNILKDLTFDEIFEGIDFEEAIKIR
jgi:phage terminase Nu1 subunit (DNA packaging protein)